MCVSQIQLVILYHFKQPDSLLSPYFLFFQVTQKSGAHVRVLSDSGEPGCKTAVCFLMQGSKEQVLLARCVLENLVTECEPVAEDLEVPQTAFGRIIGSLQMLRTVTLTVLDLIPFPQSLFAFKTAVGYCSCRWCVLHLLLVLVFFSLACFCFRAKCNTYQCNIWTVDPLAMSKI